VCNRLDDYEEAVTCGIASDTTETVEQHLDNIARFRVDSSLLETRIGGAKCRLTALLHLTSTSTLSKGSSLSQEGTVVVGSPSNINEWIEVTPLEAAESVQKIDDKRIVVKATKVDFGCPRIIGIPPSFAPIPCKPVLFDVAYNFIQAPELGVRAGLITDVAKIGSGKAVTGGIVGAAQSLFGWFRSGS